MRAPLKRLLQNLNLLRFHVQLRKNLEETIQSFRVTNEEMRDAVGSQDLQDCNNLCQVSSGIL